jgi:hypothetical protein
MHDLLENFALEPTNPEHSFELGLWYEQQDHTAPALTYFLKTAELAIENDLLAYTALLKGYHCYNAQGSRYNSAKILLENAVSFLPNRPEAYFLLSLFYEKQKNWQQSYIFAAIGFEVAKNAQTENLYADVGYVGSYGFLFQKAVVGYWWGKGQESRDLFQVLINDYWNQMTLEHQNLTETNAMRLGSGPEQYSFHPYKKDHHSKLRCEFPGSMDITENYSQTYQDMFTLIMTNGKQNGTFLEIGAADPFKGSNTALLEKSFNWSGISIEYDEKFITNFKQNRSSKLIYGDALEINYEQLLSESFNGTTDIDYLQLDIEPARNTYECLLKIPFHKYRFAVITYEHDYYVDVTRSYRKKSRDYLQKLGYVLVVPNVSPNGKCSFEDWWVHPELVDSKLIDKMKIDVDTNELPTNIRKYMMIPSKSNKTTKDDTKNKITDMYRKYDQKYDGWGWCSLNKAGCFIDYINDICSRKESPICIEIGVYGGKSILPVALELKRHDKGIVYGIDPWENEAASEGYTGDDLQFWSTIDLNLYYNICLETINENDLNDVVSILRMKSNDAPEFDNIDFLYIDGQHTEQALLDAEKYASKIALDGYCIVDDVSWGAVEKVPSYLKRIGFEQIHTVDNAIVFKRKKLGTRNNVFNFNVKQSKKPTSWIVDDFYEDPDSIRHFALQQDYIEGGLGRGFIGKRTEKQFLFGGLKEAFETIMGQKITKWESHGMNGRFQVAWSGAPLVYHCDDQKWAGMLYLTPDAPYSCGTSLYAHKYTRARTYYDQGWDAAWKDIPGDPHLDGTSFEQVDVLGNVYNRLVIFDASCIHSASQYFGTTEENARLWQMFFFDT